MGLCSRGPRLRLAERAEEGGGGPRPGFRSSRFTKEGGEKGRGWRRKKEWNQGAQGIKKAKKGRRERGEGDGVENEVQKRVMGSRRGG